MIDLIIEVPDAIQAFTMVRPWADQIASLEPTGRPSVDMPDWKEWRVVLTDNQDRGTIAHVVDRTRQFGYNAWPYEADDGRGPWSNIDTTKGN